MWIGPPGKKSNLIFGRLYAGLRNAQLRKALPAVEWLPVKYQLCIERVEEGKWYDWCHPGLWRWKAGCSSQGSPLFVFSLLHGAAQDDQASQSLDLYERGNGRDFGRHGWLSLQRWSIRFPGKSGLLPCSCWWSQTKRPHRVRFKKKDLACTKAPKPTLVKQDNYQQIESTQTKLAGRDKEDCSKVKVPHKVSQLVSMEINQLDDEIKSMMEPTERSMHVGKETRAVLTCKVCGKEGKQEDIKRHIEANHVTGVIHTCDICGKTSRSKNGLRQHKVNNHTAWLSFYQDQASTQKAQLFKYFVIVINTECALLDTENIELWSPPHYTVHSTYSNGN